MPTSSNIRKISDYSNEVAEIIDTLSKTKDKNFAPLDIYVKIKMREIAEFMRDLSIDESDEVSYYESVDPMIVLKDKVNQLLEDMTIRRDYIRNISNSQKNSIDDFINKINNGE